MVDIDKYQYLIPDVEYFVDRRCFPEWEIIKQKIDFHDLTFVVEGKSNYYINEKLYTVQAGDIIYIPEGSVREAHTIKESPMHSYAFNFKWLYDAIHTRLALPFVTKNKLSSEILRYIKEFTHIWMSKPSGYLMNARGRFLLIIHHLLSTIYFDSSSSPYDLRVNIVKEYIIDNYSDVLDMNTLASLVNLHPVYLGDLFKKNLNYTIKEFINLIRVNNAEMLLSTGGFSVSEVADRCGFSDVYYFSNIFKKIKGYPPSMVLRK